MPIRNTKEVGDNLFSLAIRLLNNQNLCKLLKYTDVNPLEHEDIQNTVKELLNKNILVVPIVDEKEFTTESKIVLVFDGGEVNSNNNEFKDMSVKVFVYTPLREWVLNNNTLRPFMIMSEIEKSLKDKKIDGVGKLVYDRFYLNLLTDDISCYIMEFNYEGFD